MEKIDFLLVEGLIDISTIKDISYNYCRLKNQACDINKGIIEYKVDISLSFPAKKIDSKLTKAEIREIIDKSVIKTDKLYKYIKDFIYESKQYFSTINGIDKDLFDIKLSTSDFRLTYSPYNDYYNIDMDGIMTYDLGEWWTKSIIKARTEKSFFFKNYKIKYFWDINTLLRDKTNDWKDVCVKVLKYSLFHKSELKEFMHKLTKITMNPDKVEFDITFNATQNEIKLVLVSGIIKWLKSWGINPEFAKWIALGITIFGVLKLMKDNNDKEAWEKAKRNIDNFLG